jgi:hypothetical protein
VGEHAVVLELEGAELVVDDLPDDLVGSHGADIRGGEEKNLVIERSEDGGFRGVSPVVAGERCLRLEIFGPGTFFWGLDLH